MKTQEKGRILIIAFANGGDGSFGRDEVKSNAAQRPVADFRSNVEGGM